MYPDKKPMIVHCMRRWLLIALIAAGAVIVSACSGDDENGFDAVVDPNDVVPEPNELSIARTLLERSDYQMLLTLLEQADLAEALDGDNAGVGWTLFAPSDAAFDNEDFTTVTDEQTDALVRLHIHSGRLMFADLQPGILEMTQGSVEISANADGTLSVGGATIIARDRVFSNGVIHFVDSVLDSF